MDLFEDAGPDAAASNAPPLSVSEVSGAVKRVIEGEFSHVRVRGEVGRVSRPASGHLYFDLKDDRSVLGAICWKANACRLPHRPEEGMEVIVTGRLTTFPGASKYQLLVDSIAPAGLGALMAMLEQRRKLLGAEGLFDAARKRAIPYLPGTIGVITSPSGAVIRDILHRLRDRFPSRVLIWPVAVQGTACAAEVAAAIDGFNAATGAMRPDLIIVARGGGSIEDLWGFNEEIVVRAVAAGTIPLISAVGHETDTTLIDHAADLRAPTPTAAAELAVPVRSELLARLADYHTRQLRGAQARVALPRQRLRDLARGLGRPQALTEAARQRLDQSAGRLEPGLRGLVRRRRDRLGALPLPPALLRQGTRDARRRLANAQQLEAALGRTAARARQRLSSTDRLMPALTRHRAGAARLLTVWSQRLEAGIARARSTGLRRNAEGRVNLDALTRRLSVAGARQTAGRRGDLDRLDRLRQTLGYRETLRRGFAVVHGPDGLIASAAQAANAPRMRIEFADASVTVSPADPGVGGPDRGQGGRSGGLPPAPTRTPRKPKGGKDQGSLF